MYLLLNNNKYLDQIVNSLLYCLKQNRIECDIVYELPNKKTILNTVEIKKKEIKKKEEEELNKNLNENLGAVTNKLNSVPIANKKNPTTTKFAVSDKLSNVPIANANPNFNMKAISTGNKMEDLLEMAKGIGTLETNNIDINNLAINKKKKEEPVREDDQKEMNDEEIESNLKKLSNTYIIFNINVINEKDLPDNFIVYNFEQLITDRKWDDSFFNKCKKAQKVLDYSLENIKVFDMKNIKTHHLPFGWCSVLETSYSLNDKDIDILFLGSLNSNRISSITSINQTSSTANFYIQNKCFGDDFEKVVSKSKVGLNIHYYDGKTILELTRIVPLICAGVSVVSERSNDIYYDRIFNSLITFCKKEDMPKTVRDTVLKYDLSNALKKRKKLKTKLNFEKIIKDNIFLFKI